MSAGRNFNPFHIGNVQEGKPRRLLYFVKRSANKQCWIRYLMNDINYRPLLEGACNVEI